MLKGGGERGKKSVFSQLFQCCISQELGYVRLELILIGLLSLLIGDVGWKGAASSAATTRTDC